MPSARSAQRCSRLMIQLLVVAAMISEVSSKSFFASSPSRLTAIAPQSIFKLQRQEPTSYSLLLTLRGGASSEEAQLVDGAYSWLTNLGAPSALVAGAVVATLYESMGEGNLDIEKADSRIVRVAKKVTRLLLLSAFIQQIVCIFVSTVGGTHLLSIPPMITSATTPLGYLKEHFEFEYLTTRISFTQGLITWLAAIALEHSIPKPHENEARRKMDILISSSLLTLILAMLSFYNGHLSFYKNIFDMYQQYARVAWIRYVWRWPPRALTVLAIPPFAVSMLYFFKVFFDFKDEDKAK